MIRPVRCCADAVGVCAFHAVAAQKLRGMRFAGGLTVRNLEGGLSGWIGEQLPVDGDIIAPNTTAAAAVSAAIAPAASVPSSP